MALCKPAHVLSLKSTQQNRNVFIWCTKSHRLALGWRVGDDSPVTVSTAYRWITEAVLSQDRSHPWEEADRFTLFPVEVRPSIVLTYSVHKNGAGLSRESQDIMVPGDYALYTRNPALYFFFHPVPPFSRMEGIIRDNSPLFSAKACLASPIIQQALARDRQCIFSGVVPSYDSDLLVVTWVFPPFMGYKLSDDPWLESKYYGDPDSCDLSELMVVQNAVTGLNHKDIVTLFWENKLGVDIDDDYRIILFEGSGSLNSTPPLKSHLTLTDGPYRPSDQFFRLHFEHCLAVSVCRGDIMEDYGEQEIENFMEVLGVYEGEIDTGDPRWSTPLGSHVHAYLVRQKMAQDGLINI